MPALVLTPLPPLKPSQTGQVCPATAAAPQASPSQGGAASISRGKKKAGTKPFSASRRKAPTPQALPTQRNTLVAPMLPDPVLRRSTPLHLAISRPLGMEPAR
jgi:hypothetical protein